MATLDKTKGYGQQERTETLQAASRSRLNGPSPHQAPQRERVSLATLRSSAQERRAANRKKQRSWKECLRPDYNLGVPQLMQILAPNIVWEHAAAFNAAVSQEVEASYCAGDFFEGWHRGGRRAHGVYEGSYWELLGDCDQLEAMLRKMAEAPPLLEEPTLELPAQAELPKWDVFKPTLQALPVAPNIPAIRLPPFKAPILNTELPFLEPPLLQVPEVPDEPLEEPLPIFFPPEEIQVEEFSEPEFVAPEPPVLPAAPHAPLFGKPEFGHDWSGKRPFTVTLIPYQKPKLLPVPTWQHPPKELPRMPLVEVVKLDRAELDLNPIPLLQLAWESGPDPEPSFASVATTPRTISRAPSPPRSVTASRPSSAAPSWNTGSPPSTRPVSAVKHPSSGDRTSPVQASGPESTVPQASPDSPGAPVQHSASPPPTIPEEAAASVEAPVPPPPPADAQNSWETVTDVDAGKPRVWLDFEPPFSELPPIFMPPEPELGVCNGPEPLQTDFPVGDLEEVPAFVMPPPRELPPWTPPPLKVPAWCPPCEPRPVGFIRGTAPVVVLDVSGTMNPRQRGKFPTLKECARALLDPKGELATAATAFDVIAFSNAAWSWSATYAQRMSLLSSAQVFYSGRQVGAKVAPGSAAARKSKAGAVLMPTEPELLADAANWVEKWPEAVGHTSLLSGFLLAGQHWNADSWYLLSDGLADDPMQCLDYLESLLRNGQHVPIIHTIGFFPRDAPGTFQGRRFLQQVSAMTGGTFQEYDPNTQRIYKAGVGFVKHDLQSEDPEVRSEREWAEEALRTERRKNLRLGITERLDITLTRVQALHHATRVQPAVQAHQELLEAEKVRHEARVAEALEYNAHLGTNAQREYAQLVDDITRRNDAKVKAAKQAFDDAYRAWMASFELAVKEWEAMKLQREAERAAAMDARESERAQALARYEELQARGSRPTSGQQGAAQPLTTRSPSARARTTAVPLPPVGEETSAAALPAAPPVVDRAPTPESARAMSAMAFASAEVWGKATEVPELDGLPIMLPERPRRGQSAQQTAPNKPAPQQTTPPQTAPNRPPPQQTTPQQTTLQQTAPNRPPPQQATPQQTPPQQATLQQTALQQAIRPTSAMGHRSSGGAGGMPVAAATGAVEQAAPTGAAVAAKLQQLLEEGDEEELDVAGQPSQLSVGADTPAGGQAASGVPTRDSQGGDIPPLELEDSQELKRLIFPTEVVQALDNSNASRLAEIQRQWKSLLADVEQRNRRKLQAVANNQEKMQQYEADVIRAYADSFVKEAIYGTAVATAVNIRLIQASEIVYAAEKARVQAENARLAAGHALEVQGKAEKEEKYRRAVYKWEKDKAAAWRQHEADVVMAKQAHAENVVRATEEWIARKEEVRKLNEVRLAEAQAQHGQQMEDVRAYNRRARAEHAEKIKALKAIEASNLAIMAAAKAEHTQRLHLLAKANEVKLLKAQEEHQALCARLEEEHGKAIETAKAEFEELRAFMISHNEAVMEDARKRFIEAVHAAQDDHAAQCEALRAVHAAEVERVRKHNAAIWPAVQVAQLAAAELGRVMAFAEHIRYCANKLQLGVNFLPNTPNYDRVVEMQALNEALGKAFPDITAKEYPWPGERLAPGTGWVPSPAPTALDMRDPVIDINKIVAGLGVGVTQARGGTKAVQGQTVRPSSVQGAHPDAESPASPAAKSRPGSASRGRFTNAARNSMAWESMWALTLLPASARDGRPDSALPSDLPARQGMAATAPAAMTRRPATTPGQKRTAYLAARALSAGPTLHVPPTDAMASAPSMQDAANRPLQAAALSKGYGAATESPLQGLQAKRPASARPMVPARMSAELTSMQAAINKFRSPKMFTPPQRAAEGVQARKPGPVWLGNAAAAGTGSAGVKLRPAIELGGGYFRADPARLTHPLVDVHDLVL